MKHPGQRWGVVFQWGELSEVPGHFSVNAALYLGALSGNERGAKLSMLLLQQILADNGEFQIFLWTPAQAGVQRDVTANLEGRQAVHIAYRTIQRQVLRQIH